MTENGDMHIIEAASSTSDPDGALPTLEGLATFAKAMPSIETAYRRGYCQGFFSAIDSFKHGSFASLREFLFKDLCAWRYSKHGGKYEEPPLFSQRKDASMRLEDFTSQDGFTLEVGQFVRISPKAFDKRNYMTGKVIEPGKKSTLVEPANHKKGEWVENRYLTLHKAKNTQRGITFVVPTPEEPMQKPQLKIANSYSSDIIEGKEGDVVGPITSQKPAAIAEDFDELASMLTRLRESAHAKLMRLADDERTAKSLLTEAQSKIAAHLNQCRALGIELGPTKEARVG